MQEPTLEDKLRFLRQALATPEVRAQLGAGTGRVPNGEPPCRELQCLETHMSWVFLFGERVLKLKKPVRHALLDFSTLQAREFHCREELRLNARLAPGVYLGLVALRAGGGGLWLQAVDGGGRPGPGAADLPHGRPGPADSRTVEWLVLMRRLPEAQMLSRRIAAGGVAAGEIDALARVLSDFYRRAPPAPTPPASQRAWLRDELAAHRETLSGRALPARWRGPEHLPAGAEAAIDRLEAALDRHAALLAERAARTVEGHGDLRPEHVCLLEPPVVIDGLEFNAALRRLDPWDEIAFLAMECEVAAEVAAEMAAEMAADADAAADAQAAAKAAAEASARADDDSTRPAASWIGPRLVAGCADALGGPPPAPLLPLYTALRALLRARLVLAHLQDPEPRTPGRWPPLARRYVAHAVAALDRIDRIDAMSAMNAMKAMNAVVPVGTQAGAAAALSIPAAAAGRP